MEHNLAITRPMLQDVIVLDHFGIAECTPFVLRTEQRVSSNTVRYD
jgi:hypothetical protein